MLANPYVALDRDGMPVGQTRHDPAVGRRGTVHFVGVEVERYTETDETRLPEGVSAQDNARRHARQGGEAAFRQRIVGFKRTYDLSPQQVQNTDFFRRRLRKGELFAADAETASLAGIRFVEPAKALEEARQKAIVNFRAETGREPPVEMWPELVVLAEAAKLRPVKEVMAEELSKASGFNGEAPPPVLTALTANEPTEAQSTPPAGEATAKTSPAGKAPRAGGSSS